MTKSQNKRTTVVDLCDDDSPRSCVLLLVALKLERRWRIPGQIQIFFMNGEHKELEISLPAGNIGIDLEAAQKYVLNGSKKSMGLRIKGWKFNETVNETIAGASFF